MRFSPTLLLALFSATSALAGSASATLPLRQSFKRQRSHLDWLNSNRRCGFKSRKDFGGNLGNYTLRRNKADPQSLGVDKVKQYSGYLENTVTDSHIFFWFFESRNNPETDPVILLLDGEPGCSSLVSLLMETGPSRMNENGQLVYNNFSWNSNASILVLDQPAGTGFSFGCNLVSSTAAAAKDIYAMLALFFAQFPEYASQEFHLSGQSHTGRYVPQIAAEILSHTNHNINLKSALIGNSRLDPYTQFSYYDPMVCGKGGIPAVLDKRSCRFMNDYAFICHDYIEDCYGGNMAACKTANDNCITTIINIPEVFDVNPYDIRKNCTHDICYKEPWWIQKWLNRHVVQDALGVTLRYGICNADVHSRFNVIDQFLPLHKAIPGILEKIPILVYAGDSSFLDNWLGNQAWTNALEWPGHDAFNSAQNTELKTPSSNKSYGTIKHADGLAFIRIFEAGHKVAYDQPEAALDFVNRWMRGEWTK